MCNGTLVNKMTVHYRKFGEVKINFVRWGRRIIELGSRRNYRASIKGKIGKKGGVMLFNKLKVEDRVSYKNVLLLIHMYCV